MTCTRFGSRYPFRTGAAPLAKGVTSWSKRSPTGKPLMDDAVIPGQHRGHRSTANYVITDLPCSTAIGNVIVGRSLSLEPFAGHRGGRTRKRPSHELTGIGRFTSVVLRETNSDWGTALIWASEPLAFATLLLRAACLCLSLEPSEKLPRITPCKSPRLVC